MVLSWVTLVAIGALSMVIWRAELYGHGGADLIHTIKSGFVILFLVVALGILLLPRRPPDAKEPKP